MKISKSLPPFSFLLIIAIIGELFLLPCFLIEHHSGLIMHYVWPSFFSIFYAATFSSILAITFWNIGVREIGASTAGHYFNLLPVFASILAVIFLREKIHFYHIFGMAFVFFGIYMATYNLKSRN